MINKKKFLMATKMNSKSENASRQQIRQLTIATIVAITIGTQEICKISQQYEVRLESTQKRLKKHRYQVDKGL